MGKVVIPDYEYGHPKNEDYAYDVERQRKVDEEDDRLGLAGAGGHGMSNDHVAEPFRSLLAAVEPKPAVDRDAVLEEAARVCEEMRQGQGGFIAAADRIRALKDKP